MKLALYKGPPQTISHNIFHYATRLWTFSKYSHAELVIDGICYSSSSRDGGVRSKLIDLSSGRWDVFDLNTTPEQKQIALDWFEKHKGEPYDYRNIIRFVLPFVGHNERHWVCYESIGAALGIDKPHKLDAEKLLTAALKLQRFEAVTVRA